MKIGYVLDDTLDSTDGVQQYVLTLASWMKSCGHSVHFIVGKTKRDDLINVHTFSRNLKVRFNRNSLSIPLPASPRKIFSLLSKEKFDVLHVQMPYSPMLAARVISLAPKQTAIVGTFHIAPYSVFESLATKFLGYLLKPSINLFDAAVSVSEPAKMLAEKAFSIETTIVPNMVDIDRFSSPAKGINKIPTIVFLGRLVPRKGCHYFVKALQQINDEKLVFKAVIIGEGPERAQIEKQIKAARLTDKVALMGHVAEKTKADILGSADIAVFPSSGGESFGIVLIEAMAAGAGAVLAGNNSGYSSVLGSVPDSLFNPKDSKELAELLTKCISDQNFSRTINAKQQKLVLDFEVGSVAPKIENLYLTAIEKKHKSIHNQ